MSIVRHIAMLMLCLSISLSGFAVQAHDSMVSGNGINHMDCDHHAHKGECPHHHADHNCKCCLGASASVTLPGSQSFLPTISKNAEKHSITAETLLSRSVQTQDRPPKLHSS